MDKRKRSYEEIHAERHPKVGELQRKVVPAFRQSSGLQFKYEVTEWVEPKEKEDDDPFWQY